MGKRPSVRYGYERGRPRQTVRKLGSSQGQTKKAASLSETPLDLFSSPFFPALGSFLCQRVAVVHVRDTRMIACPLVPTPLAAMKHSKARTKTALQHHRSSLSSMHMCCTTLHDKLGVYLDNTRKSGFFVV